MSGSRFQESVHRLARLGSAWASFLGGLFPYVVASMPASSSRPVTKAAVGKPFLFQIVSGKVLGSVLSCSAWLVNPVAPGVPISEPVTGCGQERGCGAML